MPAITNVAPGSRLGPYRILAELGRGGMGAVYRAFDERLRREVALKTITGVVDDEAMKRFVTEARAASRLKHPGIVSLFGAETVQGVLVMALELVDGDSLEKKITDSGPLPAERAASIVHELALAVQAAHDEGIIHRDLKPANVLLDRAGRVRLMDFGLARDVQATQITETGVALGTPAYMAPEQANADSSRLGPVTDVYGLGAVLYHALVGGPPFVAPSGLAILKKVLEEEPESPSKARRRRELAPVPRDLETICLKALEKKPGMRYDSASELALDLKRFLKGEPVLARPIGGIRRASRWLMRQNRFAVALAAFFGIVAVAVAVSLYIRHAREEARHAREEAATLAHARGVLEDAKAKIASFDADARGFEFESRENHAKTLRDGAAILVNAQGAARIVSSSVGNEIVVRIDLILAQHALRFNELGLVAYALEDANERLANATATERAELTALSETAGARPFAAAAYQKGLNRHTVGDPEGAEFVLNEALKLDPEYAQSWNLRGNVRLERHNLNGALSDFERAVALEPTWAAAHSSLAVVLDDAGDHARALEEAERGVTLARTGYALYARGYVRTGLNLRAGAVEDLQEVIRIDSNPDNVRGARRLLEQLRAAPK